MRSRDVLLQPCKNVSKTICARPRVQRTTTRSVSQRNCDVLVTLEDYSWDAAADVDDLRRSVGARHRAAAPPRRPRRRPPLFPGEVLASIATATRHVRLVCAGCHHGSNCALVTASAKVSGVEATASAAAADAVTSLRTHQCM